MTKRAQGLRLSRETVRELSSQSDLAEVAGGGLTNPALNCSILTGCCPPITNPLLNCYSLEHPVCTVVLTVRPLGC